MKIQFNTGKTISGDERNSEYFTDIISYDLDKYSSIITRVEVHISDENGNKEGKHDKRCLLEARIEGRQPIAVSCQDDTIELSVTGALDKLKASLETKLERTAQNNL